MLLIREQIKQRHEVAGRRTIEWKFHTVSSLAFLLSPDWRNCRWCKKPSCTSRPMTFEHLFSVQRHFVWSHSFPSNAAAEWLGHYSNKKHIIFFYTCTVFSVFTSHVIELKIVTIQWIKSRIWDTIDDWYNYKQPRQDKSAVFHSHVVCRSVSTKFGEAMFAPFGRAQKWQP